MQRAFCSVCESFFIRPTIHMTAGTPKATGVAELVIPLNAASNDVFLFRFISLNKSISKFWPNTDGHRKMKDIK
jgi:hypothetical protein